MLELMGELINDRINGWIKYNGELTSELINGWINGWIWYTKYK